MKKIISILLAAALLLSLTACNANDKADKDNEVQNNSSQNENRKPVSNPSSNNSLLSSNSSVASYSEKPQFPASEEDVYSYQVVRYKLNDECTGYYFTPKAAGKYPTVIMMHGQGTVDKFRDRLLSNFNNWVKAGYLPPMVVVMPEVLNYTGGGGSNMQDFQFFIDSKYQNRFATLLTSVETGALSQQIGTDKPFYVAGFSMGGMAAVHAGAVYNTRVKHVGGLSPARAFYLGEDNEYGFYKKATDIHFAEDAKVYLAAGHGEQNGEFMYTINRYERAIKTNNPDIVTKYAAPATWGGHSFALAQREIFMYLYFATFGEIPSKAFVEAVCNNPDKYVIPRIVTKEEEHT